jgi:hypothetical protein
MRELQVRRNAMFGNRPWHRHYVFIEVQAKSLTHRGLGDLLCELKTEFTDSFGATP